MLTWQDLPPSGDWPVTTTGIQVAADGMLAIEADVVVHCLYSAIVWKDPGIRPAPSPHEIAPSLVAVRGPGRLAFSSDDGDSIVPLRLDGGDRILLRSGTLLLATTGLCRAATIIDQPPIVESGLEVYEAQEQTLVVLQGAGSAFGAMLGVDDTVDVAHGAILYADPGVGLELVGLDIGGETFGSPPMTMVRCSGPGRIGIQSLTDREPESA